MEVETYNSCRLNNSENTASGSTSISLSLISLETTKKIAYNTGTCSHVLMFGTRKKGFITTVLFFSDYRTPHLVMAVVEPPNHPPD